MMRYHLPSLVRVIWLWLSERPGPYDDLDRKDALSMFALMMLGPIFMAIAFGIVE